MPTNHADARTRSEDGDHIAIGATTDAAVLGDTAGSLAAKLRGIGQILNDVWVDAQNNLQIGGNLAHDAVDSGNPLKVGGQARSLPPSVADGDRTDAWFDLSGRLNVAGPNQTSASNAESASAAAGTGVTATLAAPGASKYHFVSGIQVLAYAAANTLGVATPLTVTTTNLQGIALTFPTAFLIGEVYEQRFEPSPPLRSNTANTASTIVCPATPDIKWRVNIIYKNGPLA